MQAYFKGNETDEGKPRSDPVFDRITSDEGHEAQTNNRVRSISLFSFRSTVCEEVLAPHE